MNFLKFRTYLVEDSLEKPFRHHRRNPNETTRIYRFAPRLNGRAIVQGMVGDVARTSIVGVIAKWLLIVFAVGVLAFDLWNADAPDVIVGSFVLLPWFVGPAALAALMVARARSGVEAWLFVGAEAAAVFSTIGLWITLLFIRAGHANSENGIAILFFPLIQFPAVLAYALCVLIAALFLARTAPVRLHDTRLFLPNETEGRTFTIFVLALSLLAILLILYFLFLSRG